MGVSDLLLALFSQEVVAARVRGRRPSAVRFESAEI
jgi:hypothetical protein